jgi:hypothetical protein
MFVSAGGGDGLLGSVVFPPTGVEVVMGGKPFGIMVPLALSAADTAQEGASPRPFSLQPATKRTIPQNKIVVIDFIVKPLPRNIANNWIILLHALCQPANLSLIRQARQHKQINVRTANEFPPFGRS